MKRISTSDKTFELGAKLAEIIQDSDRRAAFAENPGKALAELGVKTEVTVHADTADTIHLIIPAEIDAARVEAGDEAYFEELGRLALATCLYEEMPD